jgi:hypothetical protein
MTGLTISLFSIMLIKLAEISLEKGVSNDDTDRIAWLRLWLLNFLFHITVLELWSFQLCDRAFVVSKLEAVEIESNISLVYLIPNERGPTKSTSM